MIMKLFGKRSRLIPVFIVLLGMFLFIRSVPCAPVSADLAGQVAGNLLTHIGSGNTIASVEIRQSQGQTIAYLVQLSPRGYVLVAADDIRIPVKAYSLSSNFSDLPEAYVQTLLQELDVQGSALKGILSTQPGGDVNAPYWEFLKESKKRISGDTTIQSYTPDTFLLTTQWNQNYPYNLHFARAKRNFKN